MVVRPQQQKSAAQPDLGRSFADDNLPCEQCLSVARDEPLEILRNGNHFRPPVRASHDYQRGCREFLDCDWRMGGENHPSCASGAALQVSEEMPQPKRLKPVFNLIDQQRRTRLHCVKLLCQGVQRSCCEPCSSRGNPAFVQGQLRRKLLVIEASSPGR
jgi:hypothetical protein